MSVSCVALVNYSGCTVTECADALLTCALIFGGAYTYRSCLILLQSTHIVGTLVLQCSWNL